MDQAKNTYVIETLNFQSKYTYPLVKKIKLINLNFKKITICKSFGSQQNSLQSSQKFNGATPDIALG